MKKKIFLPLVLSIASISTVPMIASNCGNTKPPEKEHLIEKLGIKISAVAKNQKNVEAKTFVEELLLQKDNWEESVKVLAKYGITVDVKDAPDGATFLVADSTHAHNDEGMVHLDITRTINGTPEKTRFEITGFKEVTVADVVIGNYKLTSKSKIKDKDADEVIAEFKAVIKLDSFAKLKELLEKYVDVTIVDPSIKDQEFRFVDNANNIHAHGHGEVHFEVIQIRDNASAPWKDLASVEFKLVGLKH